jgi:L-serine/L-threonine ammonia-lyase
VHFYSSSGGNAGLAAVCAANFVGRPCTVVVPHATVQMMVTKIKAAGAVEVVQYGASWKEADTYMREVVMMKAEARGELAVPVMPFDHPDIWDGNATMMDELFHQFNELRETPPDVIACSVGGGGMFNGIVQGLETYGWDDTNIVCVETDGAQSLGRSLERNEHITLPKITSQATTLGCSRVASRTFENAIRYRDMGRMKNVILRDAEAAMGCWRLADDERLMVELSCGVTAALCYGGRLKRALGRPVHPDEKVVIIICGGQAVTTSMIEQWRQEYGDLDSGYNSDASESDTVPSAITATDGI